MKSLLFLAINFFTLLSLRQTSAQMNMASSAPVTLNQLLGTCTGTTRVRKEIRDLTQDQRNAFINAFITLTNNGQLANLVEMHGTQAHFNTIHFTPYFFPWHRVYLRQFEDLMRTILGSDWALPYWDWSIDSQHPEQSVIFTENYFGANDQTGGTFSIINSRMQGFTAQQPSAHPLQRTYQGPMGVFVASSILSANYIVESLPFSTFSQNFENLPHGIVHSEIGGDMGQMTSPNDIIFWMHHCFIDKVWHEWQSLGSNMNQYDGKAYGNQWSTITGNSLLPFFNLPISSTFDISQLCFVYDQVSAAAINNATDLGVQNITAPTALPAWIDQSLNVNLTAANILLNQTQNITKEINAAGNITLKRPSDSSPSNRSNSAAFTGVFASLFVIIVAQLCL